jgi:hypothetical protein
MSSGLAGGDRGRPARPARSSKCGQQVRAGRTPPRREDQSRSLARRFLDRTAGSKPYKFAVRTTRPHAKLSDNKRQIELNALSP